MSNGNASGVDPTWTAPWGSLGRDRCPRRLPGTAASCPRVEVGNPARRTYAEKKRQLVTRRIEHRLPEAKNVCPRWRSRSPGTRARAEAVARRLTRGVGVPFWTALANRCRNPRSASTRCPSQSAESRHSFANLRSTSRLASNRFFGSRIRDNRSRTIRSSSIRAWPQGTSPNTLQSWVAMASARREHRPESWAIRSLRARSRPDHIQGPRLPARASSVRREARSPIFLSLSVNQRQ